MESVKSDVTYLKVNAVFNDWLLQDQHKLCWTNKNSRASAWQDVFRSITTMRTTAVSRLKTVFTGWSLH